MATSGMTEQLGRVLGGRYRLTAPVGTGSSAQVFLADDVTLRRRVAVKVLHPALAGDESFLRRFRAEARAAAALSHPNLMAVYDWGEDDGPYLVLEFLGGGSLRGMLDTGDRLNLPQAASVGLDASRALAAAHGRDFVHRDIKPANLLFGDDGRLRIADFGLARALSEAAWTEPGDGLVGTARYAAPEQASSPRIDGKADVYALGLVLIEAVTGQVPLTADTALGTLMRRVEAPVPIPGALGALRPLLERMGRPDPAARPPATEVADELAGLVASLERPGPLPLAGAVAAGAPHLDPTLLPPSTFAPRGGRAEPGEVRADGEERADREVPADLDERADRDGRLPDRAAAGHAGQAEAAPPAGGGPAVGEAGVEGREAEGEAPDGTSALAVPAPAGDGAAGGTGAGPDTSPAVAELPPGGIEVASAGPRMALVARDRPDPPVAAGGDAPAGRRRRRWATVALVALLLVGAVAGGTFAYLEAQPATAIVPRLLTLDRAAAEVEVATTEAAVEEGLDWVLQVRTEHSEVVGEGFVIDQEPQAGTELEDGGTVAIVVSLGPPPRSVPDLAARTEEEARAEIEAAELAVGDREEHHVEDVEAGRVITWSVDGVERPAEVPKGSEVDLVVSIGPAPRVVPEVAGTSLEAAQAALAELGLQVAAAEAFSASVDRGVVISSEPAAGASVPRGATVELVVSKGPDLVVVPDVSGMSQDQAIAALGSAGLIADQVSGPAGGSVNATDPAAGERVVRRTLVDLYLRR